jgi:uncharacterized membrane protein YqiK
MVEVRKPADARAYEQRTIAEATRDATLAAASAEAEHTRLVGVAEAEAIEARGLAEATALKARADALSENQDAVIGQQLAENWPAIVEAAAKPFGNIDNLTVLNGASGLSEALASALSQGVAGLALARQVLAGNPTTANGAASEAPAKPVARALPSAPAKPNGRPPAKPAARSRAKR